MLSFTLLGSVSLFKDGRPLDQFRSDKELALLIYLAQTGLSHQRAFAADLLWDGRSTQQALSNLRTVITRLRKRVDDELVVTRKSLALTPESCQQVDARILLETLANVGQVDSAAKAGALITALDAYQGAFLADFYLSDASQFDEWVTTTREQIHRQVIAAYSKVGNYALATGKGEEAIAIARRWLNVDEFDDGAHMLLIQLLLEDGQMRAAVDHYESWKNLLQTELGVAPPAEITALIKTVRPAPLIIQQRDVQQPEVQRQPERVRHNLPAPHDQFFGRLTAQHDIHARLSQPWCRLVTLVGPGGVGKTRLATTIARSRLHQYPDGVWLIELAEIDRDDPDLKEAIAVEIATALDLRLSGPTKPVEQLLDHMQHQEMLLILDNFEHLIEGGVQFALDMLQRCDKVQLLVTSREALHIRAEWAVVLTGLGYPVDDADDMPSDAVDLFIVRRAQGRRDAMAADDLAAVRQICRMVEGLPLAIELSSALAHDRSARAVADELREGFDALATSLRDVPHRHRSLQVTFQMSWHTLTPALQTRLAQLAIFRGGFTVEAAQQIADTDEDHLAALCKKSLLTADVTIGVTTGVTTQRYRLHPVIRAYAAGKWVEMSADGTRSDADPIPQAHAHYYLTLLAQHTEALQKSTPHHSIDTIEPDIGNIRLAWQTGLAGRMVELLSAAITSLSIYYQLRGLAHEAEGVMHSTLRATTAWDADGLALATRAGLERARFQNRLGRYRPAIQSSETALQSAHNSDERWAEGMAHVLWSESLWRLGEYDDAKKKLTHALTIAHTIESTQLVGWCHHHLGIIDDIQSRYETALEHLQRACTAWRTIENAHALSGSLNSIGLACYHQGDLIAAQHAMEKALTLCNQLDNRHFQSILLNNLSMLSTEQGDYLSAHYYLQLSLDMANTNSNLTAQGEVYNNLGRNYLLMGKPGSAIESLEQGLQISEAIGNRSYMAMAMIQLAEAEGKQDNFAQAESWYKQALSIARQDKLPRRECEALIGMAELWRKIDEEQARRFSSEAITLAESVQNPDLLERAKAIDHYLSVSVDAN